jgi:tetratricopeptide (TPR) repeat protein
MRFALGFFMISLAACRAADGGQSFAQGNERFDAGDFQGAIEGYTEALEANPAFAGALNNRGLAWAARGDSDRAIADYNSCLALQSSFPEAFYNRGVVRFHLGRRAEALLDFTEALRLHPGYARAQAARGLLFAASGDRERAIADLKKALESGPADWSERPALQAELDKLERAGDEK